MQGRSLAGPVLSRAAVRRRRDAGGVRSRFSCERAPTTAHLTVARSPSGECARRRGSRGGAATRSSLVAMAAAAVWREQGGKKWPRVWGAPAKPLLLLRGTRPAVRSRIDGQDRASPLGLATGPHGQRREMRGGPFRQPGCWLSGFGPKRRRPNRPRAGFAHGPPGR